MQKQHYLTQVHEAHAMDSCLHENKVGLYRFWTVLFQEGRKDARKNKYKYKYKYTCEKYKTEKKGP